ncbi:MAG: acetyltransferase [Myxococcales bacterium]|nr:acetyltransferase [Myxococcales bacterium]
MDVVIIGVGGMGREALQWAREQTAQAPFADPLNVIGFVDDDSAKHGTLVHGTAVLGDVAWLAQEASRRGGLGAVLAIGNPTAKRAIVQRLAAAPLAWPVLVHHTALVGEGVSLGRGTIICPLSTITVDVRMGAFCTVNVHVNVAHDVVLEDYVTLAPGVMVSGGAYLHEGCDLGTGAVVIPTAHVGAWSVVGAGATVVKHVPPGCTAIGTPARPIVR